MRVIDKPENFEYSSHPQKIMHKQGYGSKDDPKAIRGFCVYMRQALPFLETNGKIYVLNHLGYDCYVNTTLHGGL